MKTTYLKVVDNEYKGWAIYAHKSRAKYFYQIYLNNDLGYDSTLDYDQGVSMLWEGGLEWRLWDDSEYFTATRLSESEVFLEMI